MCLRSVVRMTQMDGINNKDMRRRAGRKNEQQERKNKKRIKVRRECCLC